MANNNENKVLKVPHLRFPEFTDEWKKDTLGQLSDITKGNGISKEQLVDQGAPCILYGELYTKYKSEIINEVYSKTALSRSSLVKSQANDVIIPSSGETAIDISTARCVPYNNILLGGDLNIIRLKSQDGGFFAYQLNGVRKRDIARLAQGVSVVHSYGENLKRIKVCYPSIEEQRKITSLLSLIDERIITQNKIIEKYESLIDGISFNLFNQHKPNATLGNVCKIRKGSQVNGENLLDIGLYYVMNGGIVPSGYRNNFNTPANTISISEGGNSCGYVQYNRTPFWSGGHCYTLEEIKDDVNTLYLFYYLKAKENTIMALRVGSGLPNIQKRDIERVSIYLPAKDKQIHIANILNSIYKIIENEKQISSLYSNQKGFMLSQLFI